MNPRKLRDHVEKLNFFIEVARAKSFHAAARKLGISQPALSRAIKILEEILETRLLIRSQKGVELTQSGEKLFYFSERLVNEVDGLESRLRSPKQPMIGSLNIGTYATLTSYLLPKFLVYMAKKFDQMTVGVTTLKVDQLAIALSARRCHLIIGTERLERKTITQFELYQDCFGFFCAATFSKKNLSKAPIIYVGSAKDGEGGSLSKKLQDLNFEHLHQYDVDNFESVRALVCEGLGIGVLPLRLAESSVNRGDLIPLSMPHIGKRFGSHQFYGALLTQDQEDIRVATVVRELQDWCKGI